MKNPKFMVLDLSKCLVDRIYNGHRRADDAVYTDPTMYADLAANGQRTPAVAEWFPAEGVYRFPQGNRRVFQLQALAANGVEDPLTCKRDEAGRTIPGTGKVFSSIRASVYEGLTDLERVNLQLDYDQARGLDAVELQQAIESCFRAHMGGREIAILLDGLLTRHYGKKRKVAPIHDTVIDGTMIRGDGGKDLLDYWNGRLNAAKAAFRGPDCFRSLYIARLDGKQSWPTDKDVAVSAEVYDKEKRTDTTERFSKTEPGPTYRAWFATYVETKEANVRAAGEKPRPIGMKSRSNVQDTIDVLSSRLAKFWLHVCLNSPAIRHDRIPDIDALCRELEGLMTDEQRARFEGAWATPTPAAPAPTAPAQDVKVTTLTPEQGALSEAALPNGEQKSLPDPTVIEGEFTPA